MKKNVIIAVLVILFLGTGYFTWQAAQEKKDVLMHLQGICEEITELEKEAEEERVHLQEEKTELEDWQRQNEGRREAFELWKQKSTEIKELLEN